MPAKLLALIVWPWRSSASGPAAVAIRAGMVLVVLVASVLLWRAFFVKRVRISDRETVTYSGRATEEDARALGAALLAAGYFKGNGEAEVRLSKGDEGTVVCFDVGNGAWRRAPIVDGFRKLGQAVAADVGGPPVIVKLQAKSGEGEGTILIE
jgi:hypothetical protein